MVSSNSFALLLGGLGTGIALLFAIMFLIFIQPQWRAVVKTTSVSIMFDDDWFNPRWTHDMASAIRAEPQWLVGDRIYSTRDLMGRRI